MKDRAYYEALFKDYPDVVTSLQFREMLGGIADSTIRRLYSQNKIRHFKIRTTYYVPKASVIDFVLSETYRELSKRLKHSIS